MPLFTASACSALTRCSHLAWKTCAFGEWRTVPKPCLPPMSCMPSMILSCYRAIFQMWGIKGGVAHFFIPLGPRDADHGVLGDELGQLFLGPALGVRRLHRQYHVAGVRRGIPHANLHFRREVEAHLTQHGARLAHDAGAILEVLVPVRRQPDD